ncbi:MAG TPA: 4'-phosphopantetheinyl transferase superfamily protein [Solirubrobacterales bacterium]|nr:4'-phosphopantetheinyl transferase superfamily protein [Solirubrobacterales bacterium]
MSPGEVHVWRVELDRHDWPPAGDLPAGERSRAERILPAGARRRWVASRWGLRRILSGYLDREPAAIGLRVAEGGKPRLADEVDSPHFSLSHSGDVALIAVAGLEVGVDVERIDSSRPVERLARRLFDPEAAAALATAPPPERANAFYAAWTRREARAKCLGIGVGETLPAIETTVTGIDVVAGFAAAVAVVGATMPAVRLLEL